MNIAAFYDERATTCKKGWEAAHWSSKESQEDNFSLMTQIAPFEQSDRILDLGCGQGDFYNFVKRRGWKATYEGIDVSEKMIERAWQKYPKGRFACIDFLDEKFNYTYDWIFAAGPFNHKMEGQDQYEYLAKCFNKMYSLARKGFAVILLSEHDPAQKENPVDYLFGYNPLKVMQEAFKLTHTVNMNHTALPWGMLLFVYNEKWLMA